MKGYKCSESGKYYEQNVHNIVKKCIFAGTRFNSQYPDQLGGSRHSIDLLCNNNVGIEIKRYNTPDWTQCVIKYNVDIDAWCASERGTLTPAAKDLFNNLIRNLEIFSNEQPPFVENKLTHSEWLKIKLETTKWNDQYFPISSDTIRTLYSLKGCKYIQISDCYGLYHLGEDICQFGVPIFNIEQELRIRTKIHSKRNKSGYCVLSVTASCKPTKISLLAKSPYSLDDISKLPPSLTYNNDF